MTERRGRGEDGVYYDHMGTVCKDSRFHRRCKGRWRGEISLGKDGTGKRRRVRVSAPSKTDLYDRLKEAHRDLDLGVRVSPSYTVADAVEDWLRDAMSDRSAKTIKTLREVLAPLLALIGEARLRDLDADALSEALTKLAATRTTRTVRDTKAALVRAITYAQARGLIARNVAALISSPKGKSPGRPSKSLTVEQARAVLLAAKGDRLHCYVVLSLLVGVRTEEARELDWDHMHHDAKDPSVDVFRSVREGGDTKTKKSRRSLALPRIAVVAVYYHRDQQDAEREAAGERWKETGLVFTNTLGGPLDAHNVRRSFRRICARAGIGEDWTPRELRHSFVSILSDSGVEVTTIADLLGHAGGSRVTEQVYRHNIRPVLTKGAEPMDDVFRGTLPRRRVVRPKPKPADENQLEAEAGGAS